MSEKEQIIADMNDLGLDSIELQLGFLSLLETMTNSMSDEDKSPEDKEMLLKDIKEIKEEINIG